MTCGDRAERPQTALCMEGMWAYAAEGCSCSREPLTQCRVTGHDDGLILLRPTSATTTSAHCLTSAASSDRLSWVTPARLCCRATRRWPRTWASGATSTTKRGASPRPSSTASSLSACTRPTQARGAPSSPPSMCCAAHHGVLACACWQGSRRTSINRKVDRWMLAYLIQAACQDLAGT